MNAVVPFIFEDQLVRSIMRNDEPWFVGRDVCHVLDIKNESQALSRLDEDERGGYVLDTQFGEKETIIVSEPGVFRLIFTSRKPESERFKRWLAHDVLPKLRRDGHYGEAKPMADAFAMEAVPVISAKLQLVREARHLFGHDRARALWSEIGLPLPEHRAEGGIEEAQACLARILVQRPDGSPLFVSEMIEEALNDHDEIAAALGRIGIRIARDPEEGFPFDGIEGIGSLTMKCRESAVLRDVLTQRLTTATGKGLIERDGRQTEECPLTLHLLGEFGRPVAEHDVGKGSNESALAVKAGKTGNQVNKQLLADIVEIRAGK